MEFNTMQRALVILIFGITIGLVHTRTASDPTLGTEIDKFVRVTICQADQIYIDYKDEEPSECEVEMGKVGFPPRSPLFGLLEDVDAPCAETEVTDLSKPPPSLIQKSVFMMKLLVNYLKEKFYFTLDIMRYAAEDVTKFNVLRARWKPQFFLLAGLLTSVAFLTQSFYVKHRGRRHFYLLTNVTIGFGLTMAFYIARMFFAQAVLLVPFILAGIYAYSPLYAKSSFMAMGVLTIIHLMVPLAGFTIQRIFETQLFFGPVISLMFNSGIIMTQVLCLVGLYVDEKLMVIKLFLMPFINMYLKMFGKNKDVESTLAPMQEQTNGVLINTLRNLNMSDAQVDIISNSGGLDEGPDLGKIINSAIRSMCSNGIEKFLRFCPVQILDACGAFFDSVRNSLGAFVGAILFPIFWAVAKAVCTPVANRVCVQPDTKKRCNPGYRGMNAAQSWQNLKQKIKDLTSSLMIKSLVPPINTKFFNEMRALDLLNNSLYWFLVHGVSLFVASFILVLIVYSFLRGRKFLYNYLRNIRYYNTYLSKAIIYERNLVLTERERMRYYDTPIRLFKNYIYQMMMEPTTLAPAVNLLLQASLALFVERLVKVIHYEISLIKFRVKTYGEQEFSFLVDGDGVLAGIFNILFAGLKTKTSLCQIADSSICTGPFVMTDLKTWLILFGLAIFYFLLGMFKSRANYILCRVCDFINQAQADKRADYVLQLLHQERVLMGFITEKFAVEELKRLIVPVYDEDADDWVQDYDDQDDPDYSDEKVERALNFFRNQKPYYRHLPLFVSSMIAYYKFGVEDLNCMICAQDVVVSRYKCKTLLFCEECRANLQSCPCKKKECNDFKPIVVYEPARLTELLPERIRPYFE